MQKPIRKGIISHTLMVEDLGRRSYNNMNLYVLRLYNRLDETKKGEIACDSAEGSRQWIEAFEHIKQQVEHDVLRGDLRYHVNLENELNFDRHQNRVRRYTHGLRRLIRLKSVGDAIEDNLGDTIDRYLWKCVYTVNGIRIFEDVTDSKDNKRFLVKSVAVVNAGLDTVFETIYNLDKRKRYEWDTLTSDLERAEEVDGHFDIVYGTYDSKYLSRWHSKMDFVFSRQWFRSQDTYTILQTPIAHNKYPKKNGYQRRQINPSTWEIRKLDTPQYTNFAKYLVTLTLEIRSTFWDIWKKRYGSNFERTIPFALLCQVAGLREYFAANPPSNPFSPLFGVESNTSDVSNLTPVFEESEMDEFYDAIANTDSLEDEDSDEDSDEEDREVEIPKMKLRNVAWAIASLSLKRNKDEPKLNFDTSFAPVAIDLNQFHGCLHQAKDETDKNCWGSPSGHGFMVRGKTYINDFCKVVGEDPLLKLIAVDWFKTENRFDGIGLHSKSVVQSEAGKTLPFILVINLQVPANPNYNLVLYYGAERPINKESLLGNFINGTDAFRNARFKLIPSIVEGYWIVKRAVGTKACLLGKAVSCRYLRQDNFMEIDVDIGSSAVAKSIIGLVLGYVTSIVVDLAILIEAREEHELPEYILGTVRLNRLKPDDAVKI
ncbi:hypothetical protein ZOSMA_299G00010 [Zostera marina]|uniref:START domain-containing protein n=1 Tax=Zostera marina TaxID=29655 RepID=A0A0K9PC15_ZOSMR|nr:hypothetical protein ZOSMA_299G00010 [Zostera marina]